MHRRLRTAIAAAVIVPLVAGGFVLQERESRDGARLFDQVLGLVSQRFVDTVGAGALYEKAARGLVKELNDPYSELFTPKELASFSQQTERQVRRHRHADRGSAGRDHASARSSRTRRPRRRRARGRSDRLRRLALDARMDDAAGLRLPHRRAGHEGHGEVRPRPGVPSPIDDDLHAAGDPHPGRAVRDRARQQDRLHPAAALQRDVGRGGGDGRRRAAEAKASRASSSTCAATRAASSSRASRCRTSSSRTARRS